MKYLIALITLMVTPLHADVFSIDQFSLDQYKGKVIYLDFWASWCKPCQKSFPWMNSLQDKYPADRFRVVTINLDSETAAMQDFLRKVPAQFDVYHDSKGKIAEAFKLEGMPTSYLIDANGKVVKKHIGFFTKKKAQYEQEIEALL